MDLTVGEQTTIARPKMEEADSATKCAAFANIPVIQQSHAAMLAQTKARLPLFK